MKTYTRLGFVLLLAILGTLVLLAADGPADSRSFDGMSSDPYGPPPSVNESAGVPGHSVELPAPLLTPTANDRLFSDRAVESYTPPMFVTPHEGLLAPRRITEKDFYLNLVDVSNTERMVIKFTEESRIRWSGAPYSKTGANVKPLLDLLARYPQHEFHRQTMQLSEEVFDYWEANGERNTGQDLANLNNFYVWETEDNPDPMGLILDVIALDVVETAFYEPIAKPACTDIAPATPNWVANQDYLEAAPTGVDAQYAGTYHSGGRGHPGAWCIDIEWNWTEDHEDFPTAFAVLGGGDLGNPADHGDACVSIVAACNTGNYGVQGVSYNVYPKAISHPVQGGWVPAFNLASSYLFAGESYWIEIHAEGPNPGYPCDVGCGNCDQFRYIAVEYWDDAFTAIQTHTANGRIVYEAAGNGQMDLDNAVYANKFQRWFRDSGAILCGAAVPGTRAAECWSNYGSRLDLQGWGSQIYAAGYGSLYNPTGNRNQMYTSSFGGTSGATPIVTGAGNCLQGISQDKYGITLTPANMRSYMSVTGTAWTGTRDVGERPNLVNAINWIEPDVAPYTRAGWYHSLTPRNAAGATGASCPITSTLTGNSAATYWNVSGRNWGYSPAPYETASGEVWSELYLDDVYIRWFHWTPHVDPLTDFYYVDAGPDNVRGGRHSVQWYLDPADAFAEYSETNNSTTRQFVWSPYQMAAVGGGYERSAPPLKNWGSPTYYNGDGLRAQSSSWWLGVAVQPQSGNDMDLYSYADGYTSTSGFDAAQASSARGTGYTDLILVNGNVVGNDPVRCFQAIRYSDASTSDYRVEADSANTNSWYPPYTSTVYLGSNEVLDLYEVRLYAGSQYFFGIKDVGANVDLTLLLFDQGRDYYDYYDYLFRSEQQGHGGNEYIVWTCDTTGWYAVVVLKNGYESYGDGGWYTIMIETPGIADLQTGAGRTGWGGAIVPRNAADAIETNCPLPAAVQGNTTNYLNMTWYNDGTASASGHRNSFFLDEALLVNWFPALLNPWSYDEYLNYNSGTIRGGRHTIKTTLDNLNAVSESDETDNEISIQYVWSPLNLPADAGQTRSYPPERGTGAFPNADGFQINMPTNVASGLIMLAFTTTADYDVRLYSDYSGTTSGYSTLLTSSAYVSGAPDYVIVPYRRYYTQTSWYPCVIEYNDATDQMRVEFDHTLNGGIFTDGPWSLSDPDTISSTGIWNLYEIQLSAGTTYRILCDVLSGTADVELRLHRDSLDYQSRSMAIATANTGGGGVDEELVYTPTVSDWYILVVSKDNATEISNSSIYNLSGGPAYGNPLPVDDLVAQWWNSPLGIRLLWRHVTQDVNGNPLPSRRYVIHRNTTPGFVPSSADSIGGTTDSLYVDPNPFATEKYIYKVVVKTN